MGFKETFSTKIKDILSQKPLTIAERAAVATAQKRVRRLVPIVLSMLAVIIVIMFLMGYAYTRFGSFTVKVDKTDHLKCGIALSEKRSFESSTAYLNCRADETITNIDGKVLDDIDLGSIDGADNGQNYICYTFYLKNTGQKTIDYEEQIVIANMTLGIEKAVRVRVISKLNNDPAQTVDYARAAGVVDGVSIPEEGTTMFYSKNIVLRNMIENFNPDDVMKYTIVIWLEGPDADCVDDIIGGEFKIDMSFSIEGSSDDTQTEETTDSEVQDA